MCVCACLISHATTLRCIQLQTMELVAGSLTTRSLQLASLTMLADAVLTKITDGAVTGTYKITDGAVAGSRKYSFQNGVKTYFVI